MSEAGRYRFERKFVVPGVGPTEVDRLVRSNPALFREEYPPRWINNVYLDTPYLASVRENIDGVSSRAKARIRWYGELSGRVAEPMVEFKIKRGMLGRKLASRLVAVDVESACHGRGIRAAIAESDLPEAQFAWLSTRRPTLLNRYHRKYYRSADGRFRMTIDRGMSYRSTGSISGRPLRWVRDHGKTILELKYAQEHGGSASNVSRHIPFRVSRSSKYLTGMQLVYRHL